MTSKWKLSRKSAILFEANKKTIIKAEKQKIGNSAFEKLVGVLFDSDFSITHSTCKKTTLKLTH